MARRWSMNPKLFGWVGYLLVNGNPIPA
jgi:hypothetical protein